MPADTSSMRKVVRFSPMTWLAGGTVLAAVAEWLMFELLRTPYRPPADMLTLLGTEKYALVAFMIGLSVVWLIFATAILTTTKLSLRNYLTFTALIAFVISFFSYISAYPHRPVTPWHLLWS